ncbi:MAG: PQQ-binding-like beta-propeller repeat protein [Candidatus Hydrogenedentes bacterium]|nr:PQQ-binding-like beta-propeller repeat protein [Candidatus Hydrogenedentota bacterium]
MGRCVVVLVWVCTAAWGFQTNGKAPAALILSPVNATWAANNVSYWRDKGYSGFLLTGMADNAVAAADNTKPAADQPPSTPLIREVRLAHERLAQAGLANNFLYVKFEAADSGFSSTSAATSAVDATRLAARLCAAIGLKGIAFDSASSSGFYDYRWDGYAYDDYTPADLESRARRLGRSLARAVLLELPGAEILFINDGWAGSGPLWLPFFEGFVEGSGMDNASEIHLLTRETFAARSANDFRRIARETRAVLDSRLEPKQRTLWRRRGALALGLAPLAFDSSAQKPVAAEDPATFRTLVAAAKALSDKYIWIQSDGSSWWRLSQQEVDTYSQLLQNGAAVAEQIRPVVDNLDAYTLRMPYDDWRRAGPLQALGVPAEVYATDVGAALVLWAGTVGDMALPTGQIPPTVENLTTGEPISIKAESGRIALPAAAVPVLVEGLPARPWLLEAGLRVAVEQPPTPSNPSGQIGCRFYNAGAVSVRGSLDILAPGEFSVNPPNIPFNLVTGELVEATVNVRGKFAFGRPVTITASLAVSGGGIITRPVEMEICPDTAWEYALDGDARGNLVAAEIDGTPPAEVVACTDAGEVICLGGRGGLSWKRRFSGAFTSKPAAGLLASGAAAIAVVDTRGRLRLLNPGGEVSWERQVEPSVLTPVFADVDEFAGQELLLAFPDGRIVALDAGGDEVWSYKPLLGIRWLEPAPAVDGKNPLIAVQNRPFRLLAMLSPNGRVQWSAILDSECVAPPIVLDAEAAGARTVVAATANGAITAWDTATGQEVARTDTGLAGLRAITPGGSGLLVVSDQGLHAYSPSLEFAWSYPGKVAGPPVATNSLIVAPVEFDAGEAALVCLDSEGRQLWRSFSGPSVTGSPVLADLNGDGTHECVYSSTDRTLSCLAF